jgi:trehalose 6-phosphate phosphatase
MAIATSLPRPGSNWALFLDVDGTLVEIAPVPDAVRVADGVIELLGALAAALGGAVALVSGRPIDTLDELFRPLVLPTAGNHGLEQRTSAGELTLPKIPPRVLDPVREAFQRLAADFPGAVVEDKTYAVALHYRLAPGLDGLAADAAARLAQQMGPAFCVQHGKMMVEVRPTGAHKGTVVEAFMAAPPFAGRTPVFIGDDVTDEDGFAAVNRMGGHAIRVGGAEQSAAGWQVAGVAALRDWLAQVAAAARSGA